MRALHYRQSSGPWSVGDVEGPPASQPEDVKVEMAYASLNPIDLQLWQGVGGIPTPLPHVPGVEGSGWLDGKPVMLFGHGLGVGRWGAAADEVVISRDAIFAVPDGLDLAIAAVCGASGATAVRLFELAQARPGDTVMVYGAAGNVGFMLTSLLSHAGVRVLGQVRDRAKASIVERAGGEPLVARDPGELADLLADVSLSVVADPLGGHWTQTAVDALAVGGNILSYGSIVGPVTLDTRTFYRKGLTMRGYSGLSDPASHARCVGLALQAAADGRMQARELLREFSLDRGMEAFEALREGSAGKVLVKLGRS